MNSRIDRFPVEFQGDLEASGFELESQKTPISSDLGAYLLLIRLSRQLRLNVPRLKAEFLDPGFYVYAGSAYGPGGLKARIARHQCRSKRVHWHVDRVTSRVRPLAIAVPGGRECDFVSRLTARSLFETAISGFGSSDCNQCRSHLLVWRGGPTAGPAV